MNNITCIISSWKPQFKWLLQSIGSSNRFDKIIVRLDKENNNVTENDIQSVLNFKNLQIIQDSEHKEGTEGFNMLIDMVDTEWTTHFCDDDYWDTTNLNILLDKFSKDSNDYDVYGIHCATRMEDGRVGHFGSYEPITYDSMWKQNQLACSSFIRTNLFKKYKLIGDLAQDKILWLRLLKDGYKFKNTMIPAYWHRLRSDSLFCKQLSKYPTKELAEKRIKEIIGE